MGSGSNWWRALIVIGILVGLPALAMPRVSNSINDWLYGDSKKIVPPMPELKIQAADAASAAEAKRSAQDVLQADFEDEDEADEPRFVKPAGFDDPELRSPNEMSAPPLLTGPRAEREEAPIGPLERPGNPDSLARVREIKDQLATWGADYILVEAIDQGAKFRFCCLMADQRDPAQTFPFEATAPDAAVAAESVLSAVQAWRKQQTKR